MERSRKIFNDIASAADKIITSANGYADRMDIWSVGHSHFQLEVEMRRIMVACACISDVLSKSHLPHSPECDARLQDWLATDGPEQCRRTLILMDGLLQEPSWVSWIFQRRRRKALTGDKIEEATQLFMARKGCFYFLSLTEIWNKEKNGQQQHENTVRRESDDFEPDISVGVRTETSNSAAPDMAVHQRGLLVYTMQEESNVFKSSLLVPVRTDISTHTIIDHRGDMVSQKGQGTASDVQQMKTEAKKLEEIVKWLNGLNCARKQGDMLMLRQPDTCKWLFDTPQYKMWRDSETSFLWLRGKPGAGKSVLAASVIDSLETSLCEGETLAFFYCDFRNEKSTCSEEVLCSILSQLLCELRDQAVSSGSLLEDLAKAKERSGSMRNNAKDLAGFARRLVALSNKKPLVVIDALDECKDVTSILQALILIKDHVRLFVTSRPLHVILRGLYGLSFVSMDDMEDELSADIDLHVTRELDARLRLRDLDVGIKAEIRSVLRKKAGGMFRWIQCSIDTLDRCVTRKEVRSALKNLPDGLDETYERILLAINTKRPERQLAQRALTWLVAAVRPLRLSELLEGLSINLKTRILDRDFGPMHNGVLLDACGSLVTYSEKTSIITLSHFSVKEYLMNKLTLTRLPQYYIDWQRAHLQLAQSCICYLSLSLDSPSNNTLDVSADVLDISSQRREHLHMSQPLCDYVLNYGIDHFRHLGSQFEVVLHDIKALGHGIQQHSMAWNNLCRAAGRHVHPTSPSWPTSKHDLTLYILVAYAPDSLLQTFLRRAVLDPKEGTNPLVYAAYFNKKYHALTLLSRGARLNRRGWDVDGFYQVFPIEVALQTCHHTMATLFLEEGAAVPPHLFTSSFFRPHQSSIPSSIARMLFQTDGFAEASNNPLIEGVSQPADILSCLLEADEHDLIAILRRFIQVVDDNFAHSASGKTFLRSAINRGHISVTKYLLSCGGSLPSNIVVMLGGWAWSNGRTAEVINFLVEQGANINARTATGDSALHVVLKSSWREAYALETVKTLVSHGCDPLQASFSGETPFHLAVTRGFVSVARHFLCLGISPPLDLLYLALQSRANENKTPMIIWTLKHGAHLVDAHKAARNPVLQTALQSLAKEGEALEVAKCLVSYGCDPLEVNSSGKTVLDVAVTHGFGTVAWYLLSLGVPTAPDLLHVALQSHNNNGNVVPMIICLLEHGADIHARSAAGDTVLHTALHSLSKEQDALEVVEVFLGYGYDLLQASSSGEPLLCITAKRGFVTVAQYLLSLGISAPPDLLHVALRFHTKENILSMIVCLLENGANVRARTAVGDSVLHVTLQSFWGEDNTLEVAKVLISHGCDPFEASSSGETPLHFAVKRGFVSVARYLISLGVSPSSNMLQVALESFRKQDTASMILFLVENGANVNARTTGGDPVLHAALQSLWHDDYALQVAKALISHGCEPLQANSSGEIPLFIAVKRGFVSVARYFISLGSALSADLLHVALQSYARENIVSMVNCLLENGANVHGRTAAGDLVLQAALRLLAKEEDALEVAKTLVSYGCSLEAGSSGETPLHIVVGRGFVSVARYLISLGISPSPDLLHVALQSCSYVNGGIVKLMIICLLENGANVHAHTVGGDSVLHAALKAPLEEECILDIAKVLVCHGCDPLEGGSTGKTLAYIAVEHGFVSIARYFMSLGVPLACTAGDPVLHVVLQSLVEEERAIETVKLLIRHGCDPLEPDSRGKTPLCIAVERGRISLARILLSVGSPSALLSDVLWVALRSEQFQDKLQMIKFLVDQGASALTKSQNGDTLLHIAIPSVANDEVVQVVTFLLGQGCDPTTPNAHGTTPFHIAVERRCIAVVELFLSLNVPLPLDILFTAIQPGSSAALDWGVSDSSLQIVKLLVASGCETQVCDAAGQTPLDAAIGVGHVGIVDYLLSLSELGIPNSVAVIS